MTKRRDRTMRRGEGSGRKLRGSAHDMVIETRVARWDWMSASSSWTCTWIAKTEACGRLAERVELSARHGWKPDQLLVEYKMKHRACMP